MLNVTFEPTTVGTEGGRKTGTVYLEKHRTQSIMAGPHGIEPCPTALQAAVRTSYTRDPKFGACGWSRTNSVPQLAQPSKSVKESNLHNEPSPVPIPIRLHMHILVGSGGFEPLAGPTDLILNSNGFTDRRPEHSPNLLLLVGNDPTYSRSNNCISSCRSGPTDFRDPIGFIYIWCAGLDSN